MAESRSNVLTVRITPDEKKTLASRAGEAGYSNVGDYVRSQLFGASSTTTPQYASVENRLTEVERALEMIRGKKNGD